MAITTGKPKYYSCLRFEEEPFCKGCEKMYPVTDTKYYDEGLIHKEVVVIRCIDINFCRDNFADTGTKE